LISHHAVKRVNFTGSTRVGKIITGIAAKYLKPVLLELGGKAPLLVLDDADLDAAVDATVFGAFANSGQICMSTERVIVDEKVADQFAAKLAKRVAALPTGDPRKDALVVAEGSPVLAGFAWPEAVQRLAGSLQVGVEGRGRGSVVLFAQDPVYRLFWRGTAPLFLNAVLFGPSTGLGGRF